MRTTIGTLKAIRIKLRMLTNSKRLISASIRPAPHGSLRTEITSGNLFMMVRRRRKLFTMVEKNIFYVMI
jgi:hypothetical protein